MSLGVRSTSCSTRALVGGDLSVPQHRDPAENRVERGAQLVRQGGEKLVLQHVGALGLAARAVQLHQHVAQFVLTRPAAQRGLNRTDDGRWPERPIEARHGAQRFERRERDEGGGGGGAALIACEQQNRHFRPAGLGIENVRELVERRIAERLFAQKHRAGAESDFFT